MKTTKKTPKLDLSTTERAALRSHHIRLNELHDIDAQQLSAQLDISLQRAKELKAMAAFQRIPSIGPLFAKDLMLLGYYRLEDIKGKDGALLIEQLERLYGVQIDPCVEDQFRLVVHFAENPDSDKQWWDFTEERKQYRLLHGYPADRPSKA
ncbi:Pathogenicity locus [Brevibacillus fluminis]|uniref:Pathogenicity locus n=1 Tax=Brevibacillus fluminis TaxID=511487 RepID=A0A3M8CUP6_9BACL|nr:helix-hairpin-helix domain-containing protein [Brevibacillus fluminis]RNB78555.1 Pathogenicity locus [Brevibacillus fluminis]